MHRQSAYVTVPNTSTVYCRLCDGPDTVAMLSKSVAGSVSSDCDPLFTLNSS